MKEKNAILAITVASILLVIGVFFTHSRLSGLTREGDRKCAGPEGNGETLPKTIHSGLDGDISLDGAPFDAMDKEDFIEKLRELFADGLHHPRIQLEAIESLIRFLKVLYPDSWEQHIREYLSAAFPDRASELFENYRKLAAYREWVKDNHSMLTGLDRNRLDDVMMDKRKEFFGDDALKIWEMELKRKEVKTVLSEIQSESDLPFEQKTDYYRTQLDAIYGDASRAYIQSNQQSLMSQFLEVKSIQKDLHAMDREERKERLTFLRKSMGLDETALQRWNRLDDTRDERWAKGIAYMKARNQALKKTPATEREQILDQLRQEHFGSEAETVKREELSGFYRFNRPRVYGKN